MPITYPCSPALWQQYSPPQTCIAEMPANRKKIPFWCVYTPKLKTTRRYLPSLLPNPTSLPTNVKLIDLNNNSSNNKMIMNADWQTYHQKNNLMQLPLTKLISRLSHFRLRIYHVSVEYLLVLLGVYTRLNSTKLM